MQIIHTAAQLWLKQEGFYTGKIDGDWGTKSIAAAAAWQKTLNHPAAAPEDDGSEPWEVAMNYIGTREIPGKEHNPKILGWLKAIGAAVYNDETAWCSTFVNYCAMVTGRERTGKLNARSWLEVGEPVPLDKAKKGDVVILWRVSKTSWEGHVAFLDHYNAKRGLIYLNGGNQNNEVNITSYPAYRLLGVRRLRSLSLLERKTA